MADQSSLPAQPYPLSIDEIERLVKSLYEPGNAKKISETEATLRVLQHSPHGWELADSLLTSADENVRFFGALTFTIKLNTDSSSISEQDSQQLLFKLIHHLVSRPTTSVSSRKLCSTLSLYFSKSASTWVQCIRSLAASFACQRPILGDELDNQPSVWDIIPQLPFQQVLLLLEFASNVAHEVKNLPEQPATPHERMMANLEGVEALLHVALGGAIRHLSCSNQEPDHALLTQQGDRTCAAAFNCFSAWIFYAQYQRYRFGEKLQHLQSVTELALGCLEYHVDDAMDFVTDVLERYPDFLDEKPRQVLWETIMGPWGMEILKNLDAEAVSLARVIGSFGQDLVENHSLFLEPDLTQNQQVMSICHELLKHPGIVGEEDDVAPVIMDFWAAYITEITISVDEIARSHESRVSGTDLSKRASDQAFQAILEMYEKIIFPPTAVTKTWDDDAKKTFKVFRVDVRDNLQEAYELMGEELLEYFVKDTIKSLEEGNWLRLEAGLFSLMSVLDASAEYNDGLLQQLFNRPLYTVITGNAEIPAVTRRTAVDMVAALDGFFLRHPGYLPQVLPFLLSALAQASLAHGAARSFASLCSKCRKSLTGELDSFFQMYRQFLSYETAEEFTKSKVLEGIAAIVQAQDSDDKRLVGVQQMFQFVANDAMQAIDAAKNDNGTEQGQVLALTTLKCLVSIAKSLQASDEEVIDLVSNRAPSQFWTQGPGKEVQNQIVNFVNYLTQVFSMNDEIIEAACNVFRAGFKETVPGPFVLPPAATIDYIIKTHLQTPRLPYVLETACCWMSSKNYGNGPDSQLQTQRLLHHVLGILQALQHPRSDPEVSVGCIELIQKFITANPQIFTTEHPDVVKGMFDFSIECIRSPEVLPKRAAAQLWKDIFELCGNTRSPNQRTGQEIVNHFGKAVTFAFIFNVCGEIDATSLEHIIGPLRKLATSDRNAPSNVANALAEQPLLARVSGDPAVDEVTNKFIDALFRNTSRSDAFKRTVRDFWRKCKEIQMQLGPQYLHEGQQFVHNIR